MDTRDPLFGSGLHREPVHCTLCGTAWDERVVDGGRAPEDIEISLCPACLLTTSHGDPFPDDPSTATDAAESSDVRP